MWRHINFKSVFVRMLAVFIVVILTIYILGMLIFTKSSNELISQYNNSVQKQINIYFKAFEKDLINIQEMQNNLMVTGDLNQIKNAQSKDFNYDDAQSIHNLFSQLSFIHFSSNEIQMVCIILPTLQRTIYVSTDSQLYEEIDYTATQRLLDKVQINNAIQFYNGDYYLLSTPYYYSKKNLNELPFIIEVKLSKENILNAIRQFDIVQSSKSFIVFNNSKSILTENDYPELNDDVLQGLKYNSFPENGITSTILNGKRYLVVNYFSNFMMANYIQLIPEEEALSNINSLWMWYIIFSIAVAMTILAYSLSLYFTVKKPMDTLNNAFNALESGDFTVSIKHHQKNEFAQVYSSFNKMVIHIKNLIDVVYTEKILNQQAELKQLQAQINPHFLHNSFFILQNKIKNKQYDEAEPFCQMLRTYFNYITKNNENTTSLWEEVKHARLYAEIQAVRFSNRIEVQFEELDPAYGGIPVPKLILQPLIENSYKYGLEDKEFEGFLRVSFEYGEKYVNVIVEDNGEKIGKDETLLPALQGMLGEEAPVHESSALVNIHRRLQLFSQNRCGLELSRSKLGGLRVVLKILKEEAVIDDHNTDRR